MKSMRDLLHHGSEKKKNEEKNSRPESSQQSKEKYSGKDVECQVNFCNAPELWQRENSEAKGQRSILQLTELLEKLGTNSAILEMNDREIITLLKNKRIQPQKLELLLGNESKAVYIRRLWLESQQNTKGMLGNLPHTNYDFSMVSNQCCENVIGYMPIPVGYAGPLKVNGTSMYVPMATTEGCLVASTNRGCRAISEGSGVTAIVYSDAMTRGPCVQFDNIAQAHEFLNWTKCDAHYSIIKQTFEATSKYAKLKFVKCRPAGSLVFMRLGATTGDAMGMNMVTKGTEAVLKMLSTKYFPEMRIISLSGNYCSDKKSAAINWIEGRGKGIVSEAMIPAQAVSSILKTDVTSLVAMSKDKNLIGSALAGAMGGFNAHSANVVTAIFLATGQDPAQNISSSNCMTLLDEMENGHLKITCTMPSLEVGTIGGGTILPPQMAVLQMLGCAGGNVSNPGANATKLAEIIVAAVLAGELSLLAALNSGNLVKSHLKHNRSSVNLREASSNNISSMESAMKYVEKSMKNTGLDPSSCSKIL